MYSRIREIKKSIRKLIFVIRIFIKGDSIGPSFRRNLNLRKKLFCLKRGFFIEKYNLYDFKENDSRLYVSDIYDIMTIPKNNFYQLLIDNKAYLPIILKNFHQYLPIYYFTLFGGKIIDHLNNKYINHDEFQKKIFALLEEKGKIILKPCSKEGGSGFILLSKTGDKISLNNEYISRDDLNGKLSKLNHYICTECIENANFIKEIYPYSCNTIRFLTIWDSSENKPYIARAVHRFGNDKKKTVDNVLSGGVAAEINTKTGVLAKAFLWSTENLREFSDVHPLTKKTIEGLKIENW
jgi:hypothetical protein